MKKLISYIHKYMSDTTDIHSLSQACQEQQRIQWLKMMPVLLLVRAQIIIREIAHAQM